MNKLIIAILSLTLASCASKYPMKINIHEIYPDGIKLADSLEPDLHKPNKISLCVSFSSEINPIQPIYSIEMDQITYLYNLDELIATISLNNCLKSESISINKIETKLLINNMSIRLYYYTGFVSIGSNFMCNNKTITLTAKGEQKIKKHEIHDFNETKAIISASIKLALEKALISFENKRANLLANNCKLN